ncbi:hypothetical protein [Methylobacterium hispanicum]|uniref:hypothetical protein n=1 Tax=Methylobacterium hispanicum TaxID=270350 RepID=UPI002F30E950
MADTAQKAAEKAAADAHAAEIKAQETSDSAEAGERSAAEKKADDAEQKADDARARAAEADAKASSSGELDTVASAGIVAPHVDPATPASDVLALKRGNDPANPQPLPGLQGEPTVRLTRTTPDKPGGPVETMVHEAMVGDYLRAGWSRG